MKFCQCLMCSEFVLFSACLLSTFSSNSYSQYRQYESSSHIEGVFSVGTGAQYGGVGVQAGGNFGNFSTYLFGGNRSAGLGVNFRANDNLSVGVSFGGGFSSTIAEVLVNSVVEDVIGERSCDPYDPYDDCHWIDLSESIDESFLSVSMIYDSGGFYKSGLSFGVDLGIKKQWFESELESGSEYEPFLGLSVGFRF